MARTIKTTLELGGESAYKKGLQSIDHALMEQDWLQVGIDIVRGLADGLIDGVNIIWDKIKEMANDLGYATNNKECSWHSFTVKTVQR